MAYHLEISDKGKYLHVKVTGKQTLKNNIKLAESCIEACKNRQNCRVLLDITQVSGQPGTFADYELAKILQSWETRTTVSLTAILEKEESLSAGKFFETAARNRGINIRVFSDINEAIKLLDS